MAVDTGGRKRKSRTFARRTSGKSLSKKQKYEVAQIVHRQQELKFVVFNAAAFGVSTTPGIFSTPFDVAQGDTDSSRDGDQLMWCGHIDLTLQVINGQGATGDVYNTVRVILFQWHPMSVPTAADVLLTGPSAAIDIVSQYNHDRRFEYKVIFDRSFTTVGNNNTATNPPMANVTTGIKRFKVALTNCQKKSQYTGGSTVGTNKFYILYVSDSAVVAHPTMEYSTKVVFRDS